MESYNISPLQSEILKRCRTIGLEDRDRISSLPNDLLSQILERLTIKEAATTSILSKRWRFVWASRPNLDFEAFRDMERSRYIKIINKVVTFFCGLKLRQFKVAYPLEQDCTCDINNWLAFALTNKVSSLELNFNNIYLTLFNPSYTLPATVFSQKHLDSLTDLCLRTVNLSDQVFELILCTCLSLEKLILMKNRGLVHVKHNDPHLRLKSLELYFCEELQELDLLAPNLVSFQYQGIGRNICIKGSQQLVNLRLTICAGRETPASLADPRKKDFLVSRFATYFPKLETLIVSLHLLKDISAVTQFPVFGNLKQLIMNSHFGQISYYAAVELIRKSPCLEQFELTLPRPQLLYRQAVYQALQLGTMPLHLKLKEVKLYGFQGDADNMEFTTYILKHAVSLQKIDISADYALRLGEDFKTGYPYEDPVDTKMFKKCMQQLRCRLPVNAQLVFHAEVSR